MNGIVDTMNRRRTPSAAHEALITPELVGQRDHLAEAAW